MRLTPEWTKARRFETNFDAYFTAGTRKDDYKGFTITTTQQIGTVGRNLDFRLEPKTLYIVQYFDGLYIAD